MKNTTPQEIAQICKSCSDSKFVQSLRIMDELKKAGIPNTPANNRKIQEIISS